MHVFILLFLLLVFIYHFSRAKTSERSAGSRIWYLAPSWVFSCARNVCLFSNAKSANAKYQITGVNYAACTITVCNNGNAHSQHGLLANVEARILNLKCAWSERGIEPGPPALAAECVTT